MPREKYQLQGNAAAIYEEQKVPAIFLPLAEATLNSVPLLGDDTVLDVACGTGIVARKARQRIGPSARIVGADLNEGMIETARNLADPLSQSCEWYTADVVNLPFDDGAFSVAFCQQGIQYFPNREAAVQEIKRVLAQGGRMAFTVWSEANDFFKSLAMSLSRHVNDEVAERSLAPFAYSGSALVSLLSEQGLGNVSAQILTVERAIKNPKIEIPKEIMGNPVGPFVEEKGDAVMRTIVDEVIASLSGYQHGSGLVIPQHTHLIQAVVR